MVSVLAKPSPQPSPTGRGRLEDREATLATDNVWRIARSEPGNFKEFNVGIVFRSRRSSPRVCDDDLR